MGINRFEIYLVNLDPVIGKEIKKTRPCLIVSPNEMNHHIATVIIAPMTAKIRNYPSRVKCKFKNKFEQVVLDQLRAVDKKRLVKKLGTIGVDVQKKVLDVLQEIFTE